MYCIEKNGRQYALKVQRPGLNRALAMDVVILPLGGNMDQVRSRICCLFKHKTTRLDTAPQYQTQHHVLSKKQRRAPKARQRTRVV